MSNTQNHKFNLERKLPSQVAQLMASKWLHTQILCDVDEMASLLEELEPFFLISTHGVRPAHSSFITKDTFLQAWRQYIDGLQSGVIVSESELRFYFTAVFTQEKNAVVSLEIAQDKEIIACIKPCMQMQLHRFDYSPLDAKFRPMVFGQKTISWGVQLSYPQLFQDPETREVYSAYNPQDFVNATLYRTLLAWVRKNTVPTPFCVEGVKVNVPMRLGKKCFSWINAHPELKAQHIEVIAPKTVENTTQDQVVDEY